MMMKNGHTGGRPRPNTEMTSFYSRHSVLPYGMAYGSTLRNAGISGVACLLLPSWAQLEHEFVVVPETGPL